MLHSASDGPGGGGHKTPRRELPWVGALTCRQRVSRTAAPSTPAAATETTSQMTRLDRQSPPRATVLVYGKSGSRCGNGRAIAQKVTVGTIPAAITAPGVAAPPERRHVAQAKAAADATTPWRPTSTGCSKRLSWARATDSTQAPSSRATPSRRAVVRHSSVLGALSTMAAAGSSQHQAAPAATSPTAQPSSGHMFHGQRRTTSMSTSTTVATVTSSGQGRARMA